MKVVIFFFESGNFLFESGNFFFESGNLYLFSFIAVGSVPSPILFHLTPTTSCLEYYELHRVG